MSSPEIIDTVRALVASDKGLLAMNESNPTCNQQFSRLGISQTPPLGKTQKESL